MDLEAIRQESLEHFGFGIRAMKKVKTCVSCGTAANARQDFCRRCGTKLPEDTMFEKYRAMHRICPSCDTVLKASYEFCPQCGTKQLKETYINIEMN